MTTPEESLKKLVALYKAEIASFGRDPVRLDVTKYIDDIIPVQVEDHVLWMCEHIEKTLLVTDPMKAQRWLGFIQGALFMLGMYSIDDLRSHDGVKEIP